MAFKVFINRIRENSIGFGFKVEFGEYYPFFISITLWRWKFYVVGMLKSFPIDYW